jgi:hypothetical protein
MSNQEANEYLFDGIRARSKVTIMTPLNQKVSGVAVMKGPCGWVLNMGGRYGRPAIATEDNVVAVKN